MKFLEFSSFDGASEATFDSDLFSTFYDYAFKREIPYLLILFYNDSILFIFFEVLF